MRNIIIILILIYAVTLNAQDKRGVDEAKGLALGANAPDFTAHDATGKAFNLSSALKEGPVVLIFYRGHWCKFCNQHLAVVQDSLKLITDRGATVLAVSPQKPEYLDKMAGKTDAEFRILYDDGYRIANAFDVTFTPKKNQLIVYNATQNAKLKKSQTDESQRLPIPATFIVDRDGLITWRQFDPDYRNRSSVLEILENLPE